MSAGAGYPQSGTSFDELPGLALAAESVASFEMSTPAEDPPALRPQDIIGPVDNRQPVHDTRLLPGRFICHLVLEDQHGRLFGGTGWLAGPRTIYTAAHNLLYAAQNYEAQRVVVVPGRNGASGTPFGSAVAAGFDVHPQWRSSGRAEFDCGVVWLPQPVPASFGWFGFRAESDAALAVGSVVCSGYPQDKGQTQWFDSSRIHRPGPQLLAYGLDTLPGHSGSPVFRSESTGPVAVGVHVYGNRIENLGVRITAGIDQQLKQWWR